MSDFLHKLRNASEYRNGNDIRFKKKKLPYDSNQRQGKGYDRRNTKDPRRNSQRSADHSDQSSAIPAETILAIRDFLKEISEKQERLAMAEERKAGALESIVEFLKSAKEIPFLINSETQTVETKIQGRKIRSKKYADPNRRKVLDIISSMREKNATYQEIAKKLELENLKTFSGRGKWHAQTVHRLCQDYSAE
jgi:hypothetical protein